MQTTGLTASNFALLHVVPDAVMARALKWRVSLSYMMAMGCCGIVLVAIGSTFEDLANQVNRKTTELGSLFIIRGCGSIIGTVSCSKLFVWIHGNYVLSCSLGIIMMTLMMIPFSTASLQLHVLFFLLGLGCSITDTGCQLMTRKLHGKNAGPWLGSNSTVFGLSAAFVPFLELASDELIVRYVIFAAIVMISFSCMLLVARGNEAENDDEQSTLVPVAQYSDKTALGTTDKSMALVDISIPHYHTEILIAIMLFCFVGGGVSCTAYLESYVDQTSAIDKKFKEKLFLALWLSITIGRFLGVYLQRFLSDDGIIFSTSILSLGGFFGMFLIFLFPTSSLALWTGTILYGLFHGPTVGYCQDLNNRLTLLNENSMAIVMFGLVCGASFIPFFTAYIWKRTEVPIAFIVVVGLSMLVPLPLLYLSNKVSYKKNPMKVLDLYSKIQNTNYYESLYANTRDLQIPIQPSRELLKSELSQI